MLKRITALLAALSLLVSLAACGGQTDDESDSTNPSNEPPASDNSSERGSDYDPTDRPFESVPANNASEKETESESAESNVVRVTLTEGMTMVKMAWVLEEKGVCSSDELIKAAQTADYSKYPLAAEAKKQPNVIFPLDGYLMPNTYEFYKNEAPAAVWDKLLSATERAITPAMRARAKELGYSVHEILTIASIIEKEAKNDEMKANIASILYNRLDDGMKLQCDVTINYVTGVINVVYPENDTAKYNYNTYRCAALPAGPICNPGMASIKAALYPAQTDYLYFVTKGDQIRYAKDWDTHNKNCHDLGLEW